MISKEMRAIQDEIMDGDDFDFEEFERTLRQLEVINRLTRGYAPTLAAIGRLVRRNPGRKLKILDLGFGGGDMLRAIARWSHEKGVDLELQGVDLNPWAREYAERATPKSYGIRLRTMNAFDIPVGERHDLILNSLFMHHLSDDQIVAILRWMTERSSIGWFVNDLHRHPLAYHFIKAATRFCGCSRMIRNDAPLSVARSFSKEDWRRYLREAEVPEESVRIRWHWSFRYGVLFEKWGRSHEAN